MNKYLTAVVFLLTIIFCSYVNAKTVSYGNTKTEQKSIVEKDKFYIALKLIDNEKHKTGFDVLKELAEEGKAVLTRKLRAQKIPLNERTINELVVFFKLKTSLDLFYRVGTENNYPFKFTDIALFQLSKS